MSIWSIDLGWFALGTFVILSLVIIAIELICWKQKKAMYITKENGED